MWAVSVLNIYLQLSGVISLTSSDNEEDRPDSAIGAPLQESQAQESQISEFGIGFSVPVDAQYRNVRPASMPVPQYTRLASSSHDTFDASPEDPAQTVHMLRESVASMLTAGSSSSSATSSANPARRRSRQLARFDRRRQQHQQQDVPRSPSHLSKVSEPCYPSGQRRPTVDFDHFSEIALSSSSPPQHPHPTMFPPYEEYHSQAGRVGMQAWQDSSSTNNRVVDATAQNAQQLSFRRRTNTSGSMNSENDAIVPSHYLPVDPRLASISSVNTRSPFASIQTISPVILPYNDGPVSVDATSVKRAQAEEALDQAILCPSGTSVSLEKTVLLR
ncbi:hypothetical protein EC988_004433 [Linderina pennispora]|nr:hypothetical protein EC988_004433 [Linderina pennispora]